MRNRIHRAESLTPPPWKPLRARMQFVGRNEVAELTLHTKRPVAFDIHGDIAATGRFVIVDGLEVCGRRHHRGGQLSPAHGRQPAKKPQHLLEPRQSDRRAARHAQRPPRPRRLADRLVRLRQIHHCHRIGARTVQPRPARLCAGWRQHPPRACAPTWAFPPNDRKENIRRVGEAAKLFADAGIICITAFISPYRSDRELVRQIMPPGKFVEVYVNAPLEVCEERDPKGLYAKARAHQIKDFTGISAPYEPPLQPELELRTDQLTVAESVARIFDYLDRSYRSAPEASDI